MSQTTPPRSYWEDIFPFDPYEKQVRGIKEGIQTLKNNGVYLLEGACGTGKTLISLTAGLAAVRDQNTKYSRLLVVTSKKQQIRAFEDDLAQINEGNVHFDGLTLVGKADVCPYVQTGKIAQEDIYHQCIQLRDNTNNLMSKASKEGQVDRKADAGYGLAARAEVADDPFEDAMEVSGVEAPYGDEIPNVDGTDYCPFFAQYFVNDYVDEQPIKVRHNTTARETLRNGAQKGTCPHAAMKRMVDDGDVLIGNYKHAFSPRTVENFSGKLFTDETILIIDEAHELVGQVRDELSYSVSMKSFRYAIRDVEMVLDWLQGDGRDAKCRVARGILDRNDDYTIRDLKGLLHFLNEIYDLLSDRIEEFLESTHGSGWQDHITSDNASIESTPLQYNETDILEEWLNEYDGRDDWLKALQLGYSVAYIRTSVSKKVDNKTPEGDFAIEKVRELLYRWLVGGHVEYFRELLLTPDESLNKGSDSVDQASWDEAFTAHVRLNNCIPMDEIAGTLDSFGGSIVMSATLEPVDVYTQVTGIDQIERGYQPSSTLVTKAADRLKKMRGIIPSDPEEAPMPDEEDDLPDPEERKRHVTKSIFEMDFPPENRASYAVKAPKFTYSDRWPPEDNRDLRETYEYIITSTAKQTPGNVMIFMPSYQEAKWAGEILEEDPGVSKPVLVDESSSDHATEKIKDDFFTGGGKVLTTGLRGTLVEGVDFDGDKLNGAVICGVPIENTGTELASAIKDAYSDRFGNWLGFQYAFTVPAVRKTRQAIGRVIRGTEDVGVRVLADVRYTGAAGNASVLQYFPEYAQEDFESVEPYELDTKIKQFWSQFE